MDSIKKFITPIWQKSAPYHALAFFAAGFIFDVLTLEEVDDFITILSQILYLVVALGLFLLAIEGRKLNEFLPQTNWANKIAQFEEDIFHFALGALLNAFTLYFFKSGTFLNSLIFLFFLTGLLLLNEFRPSFLKHELIPSILIHTCLVSFFVILAPTVLGKMGTLPFILGLMLYGLLIAGWLKWRKNKLLVKPQIIIAACLSVFFLSMYLFRIFPPVPLSLKKIGIYHKVEKIMTPEGTRYMAFSSAPWWAFWKETSTPFEARPGDQLHVFTRVFAPAGFADTIYIEWWRYEKDEWRRSDRIPLPITGGRRDGFRGYSYKNNYAPGRWKVLISTSDGLEIGRTIFEVESVSADTEIQLNSEMY